jgi:ATP-dependent phosphofructokinase / diphosphate-dependent phosphofructokinase
MISPVDAKEAFDSGAFAVGAVEKGGGSVALQVESGNTVIRLVPLSNVAGKTRHMPADFLKANENQISETGMAYFRRLLPKKFEVGRPFV